MSDKIRKSKAWSESEDEKLMKMFRSDKTYGEIAAKLGRSYGSVTQRVHKLRKAEKMQQSKSIKKTAFVKEAKPKYVEVAEKVLSEPKKPKPMGMETIIADSKVGLQTINRLVMYAEMLEKQNAALKARLAKIEKVLRN